MDLSVVVVNWNTRDFLERCLRSVEEDVAHAGSVEAETIVVDNASVDCSAATVRRLFPRVILIENERNEGFARANNKALLASAGRYLLLLNPDAEIEPGAVTALLSFLEANPDVGLAGPRLLNTDGSLQISCYPAPTLLREFWRLFHLDLIRPVGSYDMTRWNRDRPREVEVLKGACIMLRRTVLERCGRLDEDYFIYSEDQDLCRKARRCGWRIFWVPQAKCRHHGAQSTAQAEAEMFMRLYMGKIMYFRKHHGALTAGVYKLVLLAASLARQALRPLSLFQKPETRETSLAVARRYWSLIRTLPDL